MSFKEFLPKYTESKKYSQYLANDKEYVAVLNRRPTLEQIQRLPKVLLHDHLDGGLRPSTVLEIANRIGYQLPCNNVDDLGKWFAEASSSGSLVRYLETFTHTTAVMQEKEDLIRVAREAVLDLAYDNVIYAEIRMAPELHTKSGLSLDEVIEAVLAGYQEGMRLAKTEGYFIRVEAILCSLRQFNCQQIIAEKCIKYRDQGVIAFDIAGPEQGFPLVKYIDTFNYLRRENFRFTVHAGEAFGVPSIWQAIQVCGTHRLGHGVRIMDDIEILSTTESELDEYPQKPRVKMGRLATYLKDLRIPFECCPTSNLQTGVVQEYKQHPIGLLLNLNFRVTINTDNRLMSGTTMTNEMYQVVEAFNWGFLHLERMIINGMKSSFIPFDERLHFIEHVIKPQFYQIACESVSTKSDSFDLPAPFPDTY